MKRFVEGIARQQATLFPECLEDWIDCDNPVRVIDAFVEKLDLSRLGFDGAVAETTGRPSYHPAGLLKLYIYGSNTRGSMAMASEPRRSSRRSVSSL
jgi:transposase